MLQGTCSLHSGNVKKHNLYIVNKEEYANILYINNGNTIYISFPWLIPVVTWKLLSSSKICWRSIGNGWGECGCLWLITHYMVFVTCRWGLEITQGDLAQGILLANKVCYVSSWSGYTFCIFLGVSSGSKIWDSAPSNIWVGED